MKLDDGGFGQEERNCLYKVYSISKRLDDTGDSSAWMSSCFELSYISVQLR